MTIPEDSDDSLIERANCGDADAFAALYSRYRDWVVALAYRFTQNREDALDVLQDAFAYFFGKFPGFQRTSALKSFLYPTVKHLCLDRIRKRRPEVDIDAVGAELATAATPGLTSDLDRALRGLTAPHREILLLRFVDDLSLAQIAAALEIPLGTAKSRLHLALDAMRRRLTG